MTLLDRVERLPRAVILALGFVILLSLGLVDYFTGVELAFSVFYLIPVALMSWLLGWRTGILFSVCAASLWHYGELIGGRTYSIPLYAYWNSFMRLLIFASMATVMAQLRITLDREKEAREFARRASEVKSQFLANMSHEIRTPMNSILAMADLLAESPLTPEQREYVEVFRREGGSLLRLINDILDLSRVESGQFTLARIPFDLEQVVQQSISFMAVRAREKGLELRAASPPDLPRHLFGDPDVLRRVLLNLLANAIKFTDRGAVSLTVERDPGGRGTLPLRFTVTDTGIGIPEEHLPRLFDRFSQADTSITRRFGGSGLGLNISRMLVELMDGKIGASSRLGEGTTLFFAVPFEPVPTGMVPSVLEPRPSGEGATSEAPDARPLRILLAEDYASNVVIVQAFLKGTPYVLDVAKDGGEAVERFRSDRYDVILMDLQMPVKDGYAATREIRAIEKERSMPPVPIVALSATAMPEDIQRSLEAGCIRHLSKPVRKAELLKTIREVGGVTV
ncbi:MAG: response regulator [Planctomycetes bacterium]|nr:response regulator [Planctomycetota bacterium]